MLVFTCKSEDTKLVLSDVRIVNIGDTIETVVLQQMSGATENVWRVATGVVVHARTSSMKIWKNVVRYQERWVGLLDVSPR